MKLRRHGLGQIEIEIAILLTWLDVGSLNPFVEAVDPQQIGMALLGCGKGGPVGFSLVSRLDKGLRGHAYIGTASGITIVPTGANGGNP